MKYKILKNCSYSPNGNDIKELKAGDVVELPALIGVPFAKKGLCEEHIPLELVDGGTFNGKKLHRLQPIEAPKKEEAKKDKNPTKKDAKKETKK